MSTNVIEIPDSGRIAVRVAGKDYELDAYQIQNEIVSLRSQISDEDKPIQDFHAGVVEILKKHGLPELNHFQADRLLSAFQKAVAELGNELAGESMHSSPASTEPTSSSSHQE